jgi:putative two-component system response regulator
MVAHMSQSEFWVAALDRESESARIISRTLEQAGYPEPVYFADPAGILARIETFIPTLVIVNLDIADLVFIRGLRNVLPPDLFLPILALGQVSSPKIAERAVDAGASDFLAKPLSAHRVRQYVGSLLKTSARVRSVRPLVDELLKAIEPDSGSSNLELIAGLGQLAEMSDDETGEHAIRVGRLSGDLAHELGVAPDEVQLIELAAPLHDLGKVFVAERILCKRGYFVKFERKLMQQHVLGGIELLGGSSSGVTKTAEVIARTHHERWDGDGYPARLAGACIPLAGRIVAVAEAFEAMTHLRPHRNAASVGDALAEIRRERGRQFDPDVVDAFLGMEDRVLCIASHLLEGWASRLPIGV